MLKHFFWPFIVQQGGFLLKQFYQPKICFSISKTMMNGETLGKLPHFFQDNINKGFTHYK